MKKLKTVLLTLAVMVTVALGLGREKVNAAEAIQFEEIPITIVDDMTDFDATVNQSWKVKYYLNSSAGIEEQSYYAKFTLPKDSIVRIKSATENEAFFSNRKELLLYGTSAMDTILVLNDIGDGKGDDWISLKAGTYYLKCYSTLDMRNVSYHSVKVSIGAIPASKAVTFTQTPSADNKSVTVAVAQHFAEAGVIDYYGYAEGKVGASCKDWVKIDTAAPQFTVTKGGWYTVKIHVNSTVSLNQNMDYYVPVKVTGIDTEAPIVTGVSANKYYRKAVTVKFSDAVSGVQSALLNGKSIKSGKKIKTDGKYTLKVTDNLGNSKTVKFVVDKKAPTTNVKAKTYSGTVKITFQDKTAGIQSATLNGKKIKSGKTVKAKGSYTLKITDKAGNVKTVKFAIKK